MPICDILPATQRILHFHLPIWHYPTQFRYCYTAAMYCWPPPSVSACSHPFLSALPAFIYYTAYSVQGHISCACAFSPPRFLHLLCCSATTPSLVAVLCSIHTSYATASLRRAFQRGSSHAHTSLLTLKPDHHYCTAFPPLPTYHTYKIAMATLDFAVARTVVRPLPQHNDTATSRICAHTHHAPVCVYTHTVLPKVVFCVPELLPFADMPTTFTAPRSTQLPHSWTTLQPSPVPFFRVPLTTQFHRTL